MRFYPGCLGRGFATVLFLVVLNIQSGTSVNNLRVLYKWKLVDYAWPDNATRELFPHYVQKNHIPLGIEVTDDKIFLTIPRWIPGVAATLNFIYRNDTSESPLLHPYPSWEAHTYGEGKVPDLISVYRIRADKCGRLWVVDTGREGTLYPKETQAQPSLTVYDLSTDQVLRKYVIPVEEAKRTFFTNVAVEDASCEDSFAYLADSNSPALVVYSWRRNESWTIKHQYFNPDPLGGNFNSSGLSFQWWDALIGLALSPQEDGFSTLYFHALSSKTQFSVSTRLLRNAERASSKSSFHEYKVLGFRGHNGQSAASFFDPNSGILFHAVSIGNSVQCWRPGSSYNVQNLGIVYADEVTMIMPSDIKVDRQGNLWVVSDRLPLFMYSELDPNDYNFRVFTGSVEDAVRGTVCAGESKPSSSISVNSTSRY